MQPPLNSPEPTPDSPKSGGRIKFWFSALGVFFLAIALVSLLVVSSNKSLIWLTPADLVPASHSGPLTDLKYQIKKLVMPVWKRFRPAPGFVDLSAKILTLRASEAWGKNLGAPSATDANGMRAWILPATEWSAFKEQLKAKFGASITSAPRVETLDGMATALSSTEVIKATAPTNDHAGNEMLTTLVYLTPKTISSSVRIVVGATYSRSIARPNPVVTTNFVVNCRVVIPDDGALVVDGGDAPDSTGVHYWLIISPTILDARGKPLKR